MADKRPEGRPLKEPAEDPDWLKKIDAQVAKSIEGRAARKRERLIKAYEDGQQVQKRRLALGISQEKLAHYAEVTHRTVSRIENGFPAPRVLTQITKALTRLEKKKSGTSAKKPRKK